MPLPRAYQSLLRWSFNFKFCLELVIPAKLKLEKFLTPKTQPLIIVGGTGVLAKSWLGKNHFRSQVN